MERKRERGEERKRTHRQRIFIHAIHFTIFSCKVSEE